MLKDLLLSTQKLSEKGYKKYLMIYSFSFTVLGIILLLSSFSLDSFDRGLAVGAGIGSIGICIFFLFQIFNEKRFKKLYIKVMDERNLHLNNLSYKTIYTLLLFISLIAFLINIYVPITISFTKLLLSFIYFITYGFFIIKAILNKLL